MTRDRKTAISKIAASPLLWLLAVALVTSQIPASAEPTTQVTAILSGYVSDLVKQDIDIRGSGGSAAMILGATDIQTSVLALEADANMLHSSISGNGELRFAGKTGDMNLDVRMKFKITGVEGGLPLPCTQLPPGSPCDASDIIPLVFSGDGKARVRVGSSETNIDLVVVINAVNHIPMLGGTIEVIGMDTAGTPLMMFTVNVSEYTVYFQDAVVLAQVSGNLQGSAVLIVNSRENHRALPTDVHSIDKGDISFKVLFEGNPIEMSGHFDGTSTGWPLYSMDPACDPNALPSVISNGKFKTEDDATLKGTYTTNWCTPFTFTSVFSGALRLKK